jgi:U2 small nuclear ribonucleoprotein A'
MRISAELLGLAEQRPNAVGERELVLRGMAIPTIEHLAATRDAFDAIDFTDNRISRLENFPRLQRLSHLMFSGNAVESLDVTNISTNTPNLQHLELSHNHISSLREVANIGKACPKLESLSLVGNPVTRKFRLLAQLQAQVPLLFSPLGFLIASYLFALQHIQLLCGVERERNTHTHAHVMSIRLFY